MWQLANRVSIICTIILITLLTGAGGILGVFASEPDLSQSYGAEANPTGEPIGGGVGYGKVITNGDFLVTSREEFLDALQKAAPGQVIYLPPHVEIDLTGWENVDIPGGITIAGNRGMSGAAGPLIYTNQLQTFPLFNVTGADVRITGIRLRGPSPAVPDSIAIRVMGHHVEIDNCEIFNWSYAGIAVLRALDAYIHHNYIHNVRRPGLGYPVVFDTATGLVEANIFDYYRHAIAATGTKGTGYEACYNIVYGNAISHAFDMHGGTDYCPKPTQSCTPHDVFMAGDYLDIHHNTFYINDYDAIRIRGVARDYVSVHHNWFINPNASRAFRFYYYYGGNAHVYDNVYGTEKRLIAEAVKPDPFIYAVGTNILQGPADPTQIRFGFDGTSGTEPLSGAAHIGLLPITVDGTIADLVALRLVRILLDDSVIYQEEDIPPSGSITIDTTQLSDGAHNLIVKIDFDPGFTMQQQLQFYVKNRWSFQDYLLPPSYSGWFGLIDNSRTSAASSGWDYATDTPAAFYNDGDRLVNTEAGTQYLIWETKRLQSVKAVVYSKTPQSQGILFAVSPDQEVWYPLEYQMTLIGPNAAGWYQLELSGALNHADMQWFRLTLTDEAGPGDIQLGELHFSGLL
ncbi:MAG TPA: hypothetical protein GXZ82_03370 [Firmicutes bacterium]|nr:hypothetical protein [Bacillota bacterium]